MISHTHLPLFQARFAPRQAVRALSTSSVVSKDIVQDTYIRELHAYKAPAKVSRHGEASDARAGCDTH